MLPPPSWTPPFPDHGFRRGLEVTTRLLCEPNVSEGRDSARVRRFAEAVASTGGVQLIHCSADPDHNRMVLAYLGSSESVLEGSVSLARAVFDELDLTRHEGQHPRIGALDVVPFVSEDGPGSYGHAAALETCREFGRRIGEMGVPVYYYEDAATASHRRPLPAVRRGGFEGLAEKLAAPDWRPDEGPGRPHATAGAVITGVRRPLVRFNVNLADPDPSLARAIARSIRASSGGLAAVRALGLELAHRNASQVTMNLTDYRTTSLAEVHAAVLRGAREAGVEVLGVEVIGPIPRAALEGVEDDILDVLEPEQILEPIEDETT